MPATGRPQERLRVVRDTEGAPCFQDSASKWTMDTMLHAANPDRVRGNTREDINRRIDRDTALRLQEVAGARGEHFASRLRQVGREWSFERVIETEAAVTGLTGILLGLKLDRRWLALSGVASSMLLLHAVQGWYPLLPLLRRLSVRSQDEIDREYYAMKSLRGDFAQVTSAPAAERATAAWKAVIA